MDPSLLNLNFAVFNQVLCAYRRHLIFPLIQPYHASHALKIFRLHFHQNLVQKLHDYRINQFVLPSKIQL